MIDRNKSGYLIFRSQLQYNPLSYNKIQGIMSTSIPYLKKRKSFITITPKPSFCLYPKNKPIRLDQLELKHKWNSVVLNHANQAFNQTQGMSKCATARPRQLSFKKTVLNKQNLCGNRAPIKIKPNKYINSWHLLYCKQPNSKSEFIRLEREDMYNYDQY